MTASSSVGRSADEQRARNRRLALKLLVVAVVFYGAFIAVSVMYGPR